MVEYLLSRKDVDLDCITVDSIEMHGGTAIHEAVIKGNEKLVRMLLDRNADINVRDARKRTPLARAVEYGQMHIVKLLMEVGVDENTPDEYGETPLLHAAQWTRTSWLRLLLELSKDSGQMVSARTVSGRSPLHLAVYDNASVELLIRYKSDIEARDHWGRTPLHAATTGNFDASDSVLVLLQAGAKIDVADDRGKTPLYHALRRKHDESVRILIEKGANIHVTVDEGKSPLHCVAEDFLLAKGFVRLVRALLHRGADVNAVDKYQRTPLDIMLSLDMSKDPLYKDVWQEVIELLRDAGALQHNELVAPGKMMETIT